jgi:hypothetical protein
MAGDGEMKGGRGDQMKCGRRSFDLVQFVGALGDVKESRVKMRSADITTSLASVCYEGSIVPSEQR